MRKLLLFLFFSGIITISSTGQDIQIFNDQNVQIQDNSTIQIYGNPTDNEIKSALWVRNSGLEDISLNLSKEVIFQATGSKNSFLWGSFIEQSEANFNPLIILSGQLSKDFASIYLPNYTRGSSKIKYTFFDNNNPGNSTTIFVEFITNKAPGLFKEPTEFSLSDAYPNPAESMVYFDYTLKGNVLEAKIIIRTLLGSIVAESNLEGMHGKANINIDDLVEGIYFYSLMVDSDIKLTKKLIVKH